MEWIKEHWAEILTFLGFGSGGVAAGKHLVDKEQDKRIGDLEKVTQELKNQLELNTRFDKQFREEFKEFKTDTKDELKGIREEQTSSFNQIIEILKMQKS